jgi:predicted CXXCH cytochrome family protein
MARRLGLGPGLDCSDCHRPQASGVRYLPVEMERDCASCHSLAFRRENGAVRTLAHGDEAAVVRQLRGFYGGRLAPLPPSLRPLARRVPGTAPRAREQIQFEWGAGAPGADAAVRATFSRGGACYGCHTIDSPGAGSLAYRIRPVAFPMRYLRHGWFDHRPHAKQGCADCHAAATSSSSSDLLIPGLATCRSCHGGEQTSKPVASSCAMCHNYHLKEGAPTMIVRGLTAGRKRAAGLAPRGSP